MSDVERHEMPSGHVVYYSDKCERHANGGQSNERCKGGLCHSYCSKSPEEHRSGKCYNRCPGRVPGISTVAKNDGDTNNDPLLDWGSKLSCEGVARELSLALSLEDADDIRSALSWCESGDSIWRTLQQEKLTWRHIRNEKGRIGSVSHGVLEALAAGATPFLRSGYDHAVADWWHKRKPEAELVEQVVYSKSFGFAGRFDLRATIGDEGALVDLKTSGYISNAFHIQLAGYDLACQSSGFGLADRLMVLQVREDGSWAEWEGHAYHDDFLAALEIYKRGKAIGAKARKDWREWKQAQKVAA